MAIVFGLESLTFLAEIHISIPKCTEEEGGKGGGSSTDLGIIPKKTFSFSASLSRRGETKRKRVIFG